MNGRGALGCLTLLLLGTLAQTEEVGLSRPVETDRDPLHIGHRDEVADDAVKWVVCRKTDLFLVRISRLDAQVQALTESMDSFEQGLTTLSMVLASYVEERDRLSPMHKQWADTVLFPCLDHLYALEQKLTFLARLGRESIGMLSVSVKGPAEVCEGLAGSLERQGMRGVRITPVSASPSSLILVRYWFEHRLFTPLSEVLEVAFSRGSLRILPTGRNQETDVLIQIGNADARRRVRTARKD